MEIGGRGERNEKNFSLLSVSLFLMNFQRRAVPPPQASPLTGHTDHTHTTEPLRSPFFSFSFPLFLFWENVFVCSPFSVISHFSARTVTGDTRRKPTTTALLTNPFILPTTIKTKIEYITTHCPALPCPNHSLQLWWNGPSPLLSLAHHHFFLSLQPHFPPFIFNAAMYSTLHMLVLVLIPCTVEVVLYLAVNVM